MVLCHPPPPPSPPPPTPPHPPPSTPPPVFVLRAPPVSPPFPPPPTRVYSPRTPRPVSPPAPAHPNPTITQLHMDCNFVKARGVAVRHAAAVPHSQGPHGRGPLPRYRCQCDHRGESIYGPGFHGGWRGRGAPSATPSLQGMRDGSGSRSGAPSVPRGRVGWDGPTSAAAAAVPPSPPPPSPPPQGRPTAHPPPPARSRYTRHASPVTVPMGRNLPAGHHHRHASGCPATAQVRQQRRREGQLTVALVPRPRKGHFRSLRSVPCMS